MILVQKPKNIGRRRKRQDTVVGSEQGPLLCHMHLFWHVCTGTVVNRMPKIIKPIYGISHQLKLCLVSIFMTIFDNMELVKS